MKAIKLFLVKIATWGNPLNIRGYDLIDAIGLTRILFKVPTDIEVTAREIAAPETETNTKPPETAASPAKLVSDTSKTRHSGGRPRLNLDSELLIASLSKEKDISRAARALGCSRGYLYQELGAGKVRELVS